MWESSGYWVERKTFTDSLAFDEVHVSDSSMDGSVFDFQGHHFE